MSAREPGAGRILIVGRGSFLAGHVLSALPAARVRAVGHDEILRPDLLDEVACVVSFARHPLLGSEGYRPESMDPDLRLAKRLGERGVAYVMLSSRKVYAPGAGPLPESAPVRPTDLYGRHSFLAGHVLRALPAARVRAVGHDEIERADLLDDIACVVSFARHPLLGSEGYRPATMDPDLRLARRLGEREIAYVMLSSR